MIQRDENITLLDALLPLFFLAIALFSSVIFFGEDSSYGPNQIVLMLAGCLAMSVALRKGRSWAELEKDVFSGMSIVFTPSFILLAVGIMIATWIVGGIVPSMIYFGLKLISPSIFYAASCLVCAIVSLSIGSSWTTAASVGVALIGTAIGMGHSPEITAGAIISGAYFGDKMSPLSDTTNLAPAVTDVELFAHIRHMVWTGLPSLFIALIAFFFIGLFADTAQSDNDITATLTVLEENFHIAWYMIFPLFFLLFLAWKKMPALPAILLAAATGALYAVFFQSNALADGAGFIEMLKALWILAVSGYESSTGDTILDDLLSGGGAANMLNTIWLILAAVFFGGAMEKTGMLAKLVQAILSKTKSVSATIISTVLTGIGSNIITGDQYISIVLPGRMYKSIFRERGMAAVNLSRAIEDSSTVTSPLVPWNTCGAFMAASLGVSTMAYLPFCFFNLIMPLLSMAYGMAHFKILPLSDD